MSRYNPSNKQKRFGLNITAIQTPGTILDRKEFYPVLYAVKQTNVRTLVEAIPSYTVPIGWLYYDAYEIVASKLFYASNKPDNIIQTINWNSAISFENKGIDWYMPFITRQGDIIFVYRGERETDSLRGRQNPIVYPYNDLNNPVVVDFGEGVKPTAWLQNCGADFYYQATKKYLMFGEYTRPIHAKSYIWKVVEPYTSPANWSIVMEKDTSGNSMTGFEHFHMVNIDPFSNAVFSATGDDNDNAKIYMTINNGAPWTVVSEGSEKAARVLNLIFAKDYVYWASDAPTQHVLNRVSRGVGGIPDFSTRTELCELPNNQATYSTCLLHNPPGLLMLDRYDSPTANPLKVCFWSFETNSLHVVAEINPLTDSSPWGFRCDAVNFYQSTNDERIVCGFGLYPNGMDVLTNQSDVRERLNNLALKVIEVN